MLVDPKPQRLFSFGICTGDPSLRCSHYDVHVALWVPAMHFEVSRPLMRSHRATASRTLPSHTTVD